MSYSNFVAMCRRQHVSARGVNGGPGAKSSCRWGRLVDDCGVKALVHVALALCAACHGHDDPPGGKTAAADPAPEPAHVDAAVPIVPPPGAWTFVVLSDLYLPNYPPNMEIVAKTVAAVIALRPRAVVITGDFTNGTVLGGVSGRWWKTVRTALEPLRFAKIPVLPVAGNHDTYGPAQKAAYAAAFADLDKW